MRVTLFSMPPPVCAARIIRFSVRERRVDEAARFDGRSFGDE
jgi:hypothetical protein